MLTPCSIALLVLKFILTQGVAFHLVLTHCPLVLRFILRTLSLNHGRPSNDQLFPGTCTIVYMFGVFCLNHAGPGVNTLRPRQNGRHFADDTFKRIFMNENVRISINISLKFVPKGLINNIPALVQIMAWRRPGDKPLSEPMMDNLLTHICVTRPQWVNTLFPCTITEEPINLVWPV